ncbi:MAG TPA: C2 family cysteine protease [Phycisphaerae bacterium]|nr:C2 family cysteine protease [Phycisphaerae bacterium]
MKSNAIKMTRSRRTTSPTALECLEPRTLLSASAIAKLPRAKSRIPIEAAVQSLRKPGAVTAPAGAGTTSASVVGRYALYAQSPLYGDAIAADKTALLPGQTGGFSNITSYVGGINEIAVDVSNAATSYAASDFTFRVGMTGDPSTWLSAPVPQSVTVVPGAGTGGSTRVYVKWSDAAIANEWLQVTFAPAGDVFYFGNLVGATNSLQVTAADESNVRADPHTMLNPAAVSNGCDFNRDGKVDALDQLISRASLGASLLAFAAPPVGASYDWHTQTINGVLNIWAPNPTDFGATWTVSDPNALFGADGVPQIEALHQGPTGDCYFLAAGGGLAFSNPSRIQAMVSNDALGGWAVSFQVWNSQLFQYAPVIVHTSKTLSTSLQTMANGEVWILVLEKAYASMRTWNGSTSTNTMASLNLGYPATALTALSDINSTIPYTSMTQQTVYTTMQNALAAHKPVLFTTSGTAPTMVRSHVYIIVGVSTDTSGTLWVKTYNPWGFYDTRSMSDLLPNGVGTLVIGTY